MWSIFPEKSGTGPSGRAGCGYINRCLFLSPVSFKAHGCPFCPSLQTHCLPFWFSLVHGLQVSGKEAEVMNWPLYCRDGREDDLPVLTLSPPTGLLWDAKVMGPWFLTPNNWNLFYLMRVSVAPPVLEFRAVTVSQLDLQAQTSYQFLSEWAEAGEGRLGNMQAKGKLHECP